MQSEAKCFKEIFPFILINQNKFFLNIVFVSQDLFAIGPNCFAFTHFIVYLLFLFTDYLSSNSLLFYLILMVY